MHVRILLYPWKYNELDGDILCIYTLHEFRLYNSQSEFFCLKIVKHV